MTSVTKRLFVEVNDEVFEVEFSGSTYEELIEAIKEEIKAVPDCIPQGQEIKHLQSLNPKLRSMLF